MARKKDKTASFMLRFTQQIFEDEGETNIQWRGMVSHVQSDHQLKFADVNEAMKFIQERLQNLTLHNTSDKSKKEQEGLLVKSLDMWKMVRANAPKMIADAIKDPKKQVENLQSQISNIGDEISSRVEIDEWRGASRNDFKKILSAIETLSEDVKKVNKKVNKLAKKIEK